MWNYRANEYERRRGLKENKRFVSKETLEKLLKVVKNDTVVSNKLPTYNDLNQAGLVAFANQEEFTRTVWSDGY